MWYESVHEEFDNGHTVWVEKEWLEPYQGADVIHRQTNRHPCPEDQAIDPRPFGYLDRETAAYRRLMRSGAIECGYQIRHVRVADPPVVEFSRGR
jgi:hypothetical protein